MTPAKPKAVVPEDGGETYTDTHIHTKNAYQRFADAMRIIDSMPWAKDLSNSQYKSIPIDTMRAGVRKACLQAGLVHVGPVDLNIERVKQDGSNTTRFYATCTFEYFNIDNPEDRIVYESAGEAMDNGDKGTGKVISNLIKNHYKAAFDIGEQSKDDIDAYSNEEIYAEADRIEANRRKVREQSKADPFFSAKSFKTAAKPPSADRDVAQMRDTIQKANNNRDIPKCAETIRCARDEFGLMSQWSDEVVAMVYDQIVAICKNAGVQA